jgi:hypothetical protein
MRDYGDVPQGIIASLKDLEGWVNKSIKYVAGLLPELKKARSATKQKS